MVPEIPAIAGKLTVGVAPASATVCETGAAVGAGVAMVAVLPEEMPELTVGADAPPPPPPQPTTAANTKSAPIKCALEVRFTESSSPQ
jgi:hypothetical protein